MGFISGYIYGMELGNGDRNNHKISNFNPAITEHFKKTVGKKVKYTIL